MTPEPLERVRAAYRRWIAAVLLLSAVAGVVALPLLPPRAQPIRWRGDADLRHLVFSERSSVDLRFGFYEDLRVALGGGTLVVPPESIVFGYIARALSDVTVVEQDYDPAIDPTGLPPAAFAGEHDGTGEVVQYAVLPGDDDRWWLGLADGVVFILPRSMLPVPEPRDG